MNNYRTDERNGVSETERMVIDTIIENDPDVIAFRKQNYHTMD